MKKVLLSIAIIALATTANAQSMIKFGAKAGVNLSNLKQKAGSESQSADVKVGFHVGGLAEINITESFAIQPEVLFSMLGAKVSDDDYKINLDYISVPVLVKYKVSGFGVYLGPQVSFLANAKYKADNESASAKDAYKSIDFSGVLGVEYTLENGFGVNARYVAGLANIAKDGGDDFKITGSAFQFGVHYIFGGK